MRHFGCDRALASCSGSRFTGRAFLVLKLSIQSSSRIPAQKLEGLELHSTLTLFHYSIFRQSPAKNYDRNMVMPRSRERIV
jgi:hypothetical protein